MLLGRSHLRNGDSKETAWPYYYSAWRLNPSDKDYIDEINKAALLMPKNTPGVREVLGYHSDHVPSGSIEILPRSAWNPLRTKKMKLMGKPTRITLHHTAGYSSSSGNNTKTRAATAKCIRNIQKYHIQTNGWCDIGYHYFIDKKGGIWECRLIKYQGAHSGGTGNSKNIGIVLLGNFNNENPTFFQLKSLKKFLNYLQKKYKISKSKLHGHRDFKATACPGKNLYKRIPGLRK